VPWLAVFGPVPTVFKAYDIRGVVGKSIDEAFAEHLGRAFGSEAVAAGEKAVAVGRDGRCRARPGGRADRGPGLDRPGRGRPRRRDHADAVLRGRHARPHGCTAASRSPAATTRRTTTASRWCWPAAPSTATTSSAAPAHRGRGLLPAAAAAARDGHRARVRRRITGDCKLARPMKIVVDSGNGIPGATAPAILRALGCEVIDLYSEVDGDFPNHHPDPSKPENLADLIKVVHATDAELGLAFDGDGDRLGVVTGRPHHLPRPADHAVRARHPAAPQGRADHLRRQVQPAPARGHPRPAACRCCGRPGTR
jgi:phosphomannomutase